MDTISPDIRLDPAKNGVMFAPVEWTLDRQHATVHHRPTRTQYFIAYDKTKPADRLTVFDMIARVHQVRDGRPLPSPEHITALGRAAIVVYLSEIGAWNGAAGRCTQRAGHGQHGTSSAVA